MREIISLHIGQAGVQVGNACWELFCIEHGINSSGEISISPALHESASTFFSESCSGRYTPRALFMDLEPSAINEILRGPYGLLFSPDQLITGKEDAANIYIWGNYIQGRQIFETSLDAIRKLAEKCENLQGFAIFTSIGGGTGSGFGSLLCKSLSNEYKYQTKLGLLVFPSPNLSSIIVEPYNSIFSLNSFVEHLNASVVLDNEALFQLCEERLHIEMPSFTNINRLIAQVVSSITASFRFSGDLNVDLTEFQTNLVPYPRINFLLSSYSPLIASERSYYEACSVQEITRDCFEPSSMMVKCDPREGKYISCCLMYRGDVVPKEVHLAMAEIKSKKTVEFVDWCPTGFKCGINSEPPAVVPGGEIAKTSRAACMISNNSEINAVFVKIGQKYDAMYEKRAFVHWFVGIGIDEGEFSEARENLECLIKDYMELASNSSKED